MCALINTHIYISSRLSFSAYYSVDSVLCSVGSVCVESVNRASCGHCPEEKKCNGRDLLL